MGWFCYNVIMNILILGGGATGSIVAKVLADRKNVGKIIIGDINKKNVDKFLVPHPKIEFKLTDATNEASVLEAAGDAALIINAASPDFNETIMKIALKGGKHYQDFASVWDSAVIEQFKYDEEFAARGLTGLINASATPGVSNLIVGEIASGLTNIEYIKIRLLEDVSADMPFTAWSKEVAFDEFNSPPYIWNGKEFEKMDNFSEEECFDFPEPFLDQKCYLVAQEDIGTLPRYFKAKRIDIKIGGSEAEFVRTLYQLGLLKNRPIKVGDAMVSPYQFMVKVWPDVPSTEEMKEIIESGKIHNARFWAAIEVAGTEKIKIENMATKETETQTKKKVYRADILFPDQTEVNKVYPGGNYVSYAAGLTAAIFAEYIPNLGRKGVYAPEAMEVADRSKLISEFKKAGVKIDIREIK